MTMRLEPYGDRALLIEVDDVSAAHRLAAAIETARTMGLAPNGVEGTVVGYCSVVVHLQPELEKPEVVEEWLIGLRSPHGEVGMPEPGMTTDLVIEANNVVDIPVIFDGPDLAEVATAIGHSTTSVIDQFVGCELQVAFLGFAPGFPYLVGLPPELASIPRRPTPRTSVRAGSVAVGGGFASVYPQATPGGWMLVGRTTVKLFDPDHPPYARLRPGDRVRFSLLRTRSRVHEPGSSSLDALPRDVPEPDGRASTPAEPRAPLRARGTRFVEVLEPGLLSLVEDRGRRSVAGIGVPDAGAADPETMRLANRLVGNPEGAATIEITAVGPRLRFTGNAHLAVVASAADGVGVLIDGLRVQTDTVSPIQHGQVMAIGPVTFGLRAYVAVAGGFETPVVVGSRSSDVLCGLGPGPLVVGDQLDLGPATRPHGQLSHPFDPALGVGPTVIRVVAGPHHFHRSDRNALASMLWVVDHASNRIGLRLRCEDQSFVPDAPAIRSTAMVTGAIQVPPDGSPMILMPDHGTVGGYPVIACVIAADLAKLGQLQPGDTLTFAYVDRPTARGEYLRAERILAGRVSGWFPTEAGT